MRGEVCEDGFFDIGLQVAVLLLGHAPVAENDAELVQAAEYNRLVHQGFFELARYGWVACTAIFHDMANASVIIREWNVLQYPREELVARNRASACSELVYRERPVEPARIGHLEPVGVELHKNRRPLGIHRVIPGYYCIITSEQEWSEREVIEAYRGLARIEESFRVLKGTMEARPVYVWTTPHIEAHFLVCYVALVIMRLMQLDVEGATGTRPSAELCLVKPGFRK